MSTRPIETITSALLFLFVFTGWSAGPSLPAPGKGPGARTLLVYDATRMAYALADSVEFVALMLRNVDTDVRTEQIIAVSSNQLSVADYLTVLCPQSYPELPPEFMQALAARQGPTLWVGFGLDRLAALPAFSNSFQAAAFPADAPLPAVRYRQRAWNVDLYPWIPVTLPSNAAVEMLIRAAADESKPAQPICWKNGPFTIFAGVPSAGPSGRLFRELVLDFYAAEKIAPAHVFLRIEDYSGLSNHREFQRMAEFLYSRSIPFMVSVIPTWRDPVTGEWEDFDSDPAVVNALRYAQQRAGRLVLKGCLRDAHSPPFWDMILDRPRPDAILPQQLRARLHELARKMLKNGLFPLAWETPDYAASRAVHAEVARVFSSAVERLQLSDATWTDRVVPAGLARDHAGRLIVPENLGYVFSAPSNACAQIKTNAEIVLGQRGAIAGAYLHAYQPLEKLVELVAVLESFKAPFLDLADLDHCVELPDMLLLTGRARRTVTLREATVRWKAYDRAGALLGQEQEPKPASGERTFQRVSGEYQLVEFTEAKP